MFDSATQSVRFPSTGWQGPPESKGTALVVGGSLDFREILAFVLQTLGYIMIMHKAICAFTPTQVAMLSKRVMERKRYNWRPDHIGNTQCVTLNFVVPDLRITNMTANNSRVRAGIKSPLTATAYKSGQRPRECFKDRIPARQLDRPWASGHSGNSGRPINDGFD